jgi:hypothetical protein
MADKITEPHRKTIAAILARARDSFSEPYGGLTCILLGVVEIVVKALWDFYSGVIQGWMDFGKSIGTGLALMAVTIITVLAAHILYAPYAMLREERAKNPDDPLREFKDWIVRKSGELLSVRTETELSRWKESMREGVMEAINPDEKWDEIFHPGYHYTYTGTMVTGLKSSISNYEDYLEGMRRSVTRGILRTGFSGRLPK